MLETVKRELLRGLPAVDAVLRSPVAQTLVSRHGTKTTTAVAREVLERAREEILAGGEPEVSEESVLAEATNILAGRGLRRVVNATGVVLHTNLGRSVLSKRAVEAAVAAATSYSNLEYDLVSGGRGSRYDHAVPLLAELTGAEDALVGNHRSVPTRLAPSVGAAAAATAAAGELEALAAP